jgi:hypothetical protein
LILSINAIPEVNDEAFPSVALFEISSSGRQHLLLSSRIKQMQE